MLTILGAGLLVYPLVKPGTAMSTRDYLVAAGGVSFTSRTSTAYRVAIV